MMETIVIGIVLRKVINNDGRINMGLCYNDRNSFNRFNISGNKGDKLMEFFMFMFNVMIAFMVGGVIYHFIERMFDK